MTNTNFQDLFYYHHINKGDVTICAREHVINSPYGVLEVDGINFKSIQEKPSISQLVNAGIYIINPDIIDFISDNKYIDMPDLISLSMKVKRNIIVYPVHEYWLDIGKPESLNKAKDDFKRELFI